MKKVICITGPTASGKTSLSIKLAKHLQTEIINVDSVQMNKYFDIGSAKVTEMEKEGIKHHLIDFIEIGNDYTIYEYQKDARELIDKIKLPILVGGSGLYLKSALYDYQLSDEKENNHLQINDKLLKEMYEEIIKEDPDYDLHPNNHQRIIRAYQLLKQGVLPSSKNKKDIPLYDILIIYLDIDRKALKQRLIKRLNLMFKEGFIDEVIKLKKKNANLNVIGYREVNNYLEGVISFKQAFNEIIKKSMAYAKRQKTWFKNQTDAIMINALSKDILSKTIFEVEKFIKGKN